MRFAPSQPSLFQVALDTFGFPWQGAGLVIALAAGAALRLHPATLRPVLHTLEAAALVLAR